MYIHTYTRVSMWLKNVPGGFLIPSNSMPSNMILILGIFPNIGMCNSLAYYELFIFFKFFHYFIVILMIVVSGSTFGSSFIIYPPNLNLNLNLTFWSG